MMIGPAEMLIIALVALLSIGIPVVVLVLFFLIWRKLQTIEAKLNKQ
jgi:hypothetical protein